MNTILKISEAASLALHTMSLLAEKPDTYHSVRELAEKFDVSEHHLAKVLQRLAKAGFVSSIRGPHGGFVLDKRIGELTMLEVFEAIEGPLSESTCLLGNNACRREECLLGGLVDEVHRLFANRLRSLKLSDMVPEPSQLNT